MTRPWNDVRHFYAKHKRPEMVALVDAILASPYVSGVFAWTSLWTLNITQTPVEYPYRGPRLSIAPLHNGFIEFRYVDTYFKEKQWNRWVRSEDAFARLERFFTELNWFTSYHQVLKAERRETR